MTSTYLPAQSDRKRDFHKTLNRLGFTQYSAYLASPHWLRLKDRFYTSPSYTGQCLACGTAGERLDVHHVTYERLGREHLTDLVALCRGCHQNTHRVEAVTNSLTPSPVPRRPGTRTPNQKSTTNQWLPKCRWCAYTGENLTKHARKVHWAQLGQANQRRTLPASPLGTP